MNVRIDAESAEKIARLHGDAARTVSDTAEKFPSTGLDGGPGGGQLLSVLSTLASSYSAVARSNARIAAVMRKVKDNYFQTDEAVEEDFNKISTAVDGGK